MIREFRINPFISESDIANEVEDLGKGIRIMDSFILYRSDESCIEFGVVHKHQRWSIADAVGVIAGAICCTMFLAGFYLGLIM